MTDFAAIDFETANGQRTSVCSVGVVVVRGGEVRDTYYSLIRPRPNYYSRFTTAIHGLTYEDTLGAPDFREVWREVAPRIEGLPLVAHNSPFDERCLRAVFDLYGMPYPGYTFYCTCRASRRVFGKRLPNHQLHTVSAACGFDLAHHHHALADAEACARIALKIL
ncbi:MAG TPA: 3'-5' exoribonuclease [Candidatus Alistipes faecavium]|uniref:exonuclease domain-containing protein n=1 Tax=uncultured Alistipes sp. TaxID=538949 RepID=UPI001F88FC99|nr:exonuclease domain-containing protein [uncultured Alistipes sp.]HJA97386.1 3'-5' exoribonuclease [Candidatus Alistipes faecavium]